MEATLYKYYLELRRSTRLLKMLSIMTLLLMITYIFLFIIIIFQLPLSSYSDKTEISTFILFGLMLGVVGIVLLFIYSKKKQETTIIYEELTIGNEDYQNTEQNPQSFVKNLIQPHHNSSEFEKREFQMKVDFFSTKKSIQTEIKIAIKEFLKTTDLPFTKGRTGESFYLILFIVFIIIMGFMKVKYAS